MTTLSSQAGAGLRATAQKTSMRSWGSHGQSTCCFQVDLGGKEPLSVAHPATIPGADKPNPQLLRSPVEMS